MTLDPAISEKWDFVLSSMRTEIGEAAFDSWLKPMTVRDVAVDSIRISVPTRFMRDWVIAHYADRLETLWERKVDIFVQSDHGTSDANGKNANGRLAQNVPVDSSQGNFSENPPPHNGAGAAQQSQQNNQQNYNQPNNSIISGIAGLAQAALDISAPLDPRYSFDNFVVGKPNEFAHAAAKRVAESETAQFNPLFLYGGVGLGKTHLMHAIAWDIRKRDPNRTVIYMSAEKFMYRFIRALREQNTVDFKDHFRNVDVLMIDDVQFIGGKESTQEEFFHTFNALVDQGRQIVISADKSPSDLEGMEDRLKSRLNCGLVADIHATTYELRVGILQTKAEKLGIEIPPKVQEFLAHKITANVRELEGALNRVAAHAHLVGREVSLESAQDVLHDLIRANDRRVTIEEIQKKVASHFNIRTSDMHSARRARSVARPRQVAMYLAKQLTSRSLPEIGRKFGGRDHTTVMHAVKKVEELTERDAGFAEDVELLRRMLEG
ncbi:MAG: chromosomal replication initiator protein DnaA [Rhodospirillaceae bacterium]|nr:chromosomal replication initiator protein DnaA [Rhodospirillaceae bacterium]